MGTKLQCSRVLLRPRNGMFIHHPTWPFQGMRTAFGSRSMTSPIKLLGASLLLGTALTQPALAQPTSAGPTFYGRAHLSLEAVDEGEGVYTEVQDNASRLGVNGELQFNDDWKGLYQVEYEVPFDGSGRGEGSNLRQRDTYVGVANERLGQLLMGRMITPFKASEGRIDQFNDERGDVEFITPNQNRADNIVIYQTPVRGGLVGSIGYVAQAAPDTEAGVSTTVAWDIKRHYAALAYDENVDAQDTKAARLALATTRGPVFLGLILERYELDAGSGGNALIVSAAYDLTDHWRGKLQYGAGQLHPVSEGDAPGRLGLRDDQYMNLGVDYIWTPALRLLAFYSHHESTAPIADFDEVDSDFVGLGVEFRFSS